MVKNTGGYFSSMLRNVGIGLGVCLTISSIIGSHYVQKDRSEALAKGQENLKTRTVVMSDKIVELEKTDVKVEQNLEDIKGDVNDIKGAMVMFNSKQTTQGEILYNIQKQQEQASDTTRVIFRKLDEISQKLPRS